ncbi:Endoglucanase-5 like protein [Verticillium longisporum]|nr:Endoglucanase-5 like protein [Verticillium longisporum]
MVVQATNTGADLGSNHFDLAIPGGGVGIYNACTAQYNAPPNGWGDQYGGIRSRAECDAFPEALKSGCYWRFDWFLNADNPQVNFRQVSCPAALTSRSGCRRVTLEGKESNMMAGLRKVDNNYIALNHDRYHEARA